MIRPEISSERRPRSQRGQAIIMIVLILALGTGFLVFSLSEKRGIETRRNAQTAAALNQAKQALIGWSASRTPTPANPHARPGELPCPDTDNSGYAENDDNNDGIDEANCVAGAIGRVPWKTLGIPEPKDGTGETLWYALSGNFRVYRGSNPNSFTSPIDSDTLGTLTVYQDSTFSKQTDRAVAVLFAPGAALASLGQDRSATASMSCTAPSGTYFRNQCASNYLETSATVNNARINGPYIQAAVSGSFNDTLLPITSADLMPLVEQRVAAEMMSLLNQYRTATGAYPWADLADGVSNADSGPPPLPAYYNRNRFPCQQAKPADWPSVGITLPDWLTNGCIVDPVAIPGDYVYGWSSVIFYAVAKNRLEGGGSNCTTCIAPSTLTVTNPNSLIADVCSTVSGIFACRPTVLPSSSTADLLLITPGSTTTSRIAGWSNSSFSAITGYFEDSENSDNNDDSYVVPSSTNYDRDHLYIVQ